MSWSDFPHAVTVTPQTETATGGVVGAPVLGSPATVNVSLETSPRRAVFDQTGVEIASPAVLYCRPADAASFTIGAKVTYGGVSYSVVGIPAVMADDVLGYAEVILQRIR